MRYLILALALVMLAGVANAQTIVADAANPIVTKPYSSLWPAANSPGLSTDACNNIPEGKYCYLAINQTDRTGTSGVSGTTRTPAAGAEICLNPDQLSNETSTTLVVDVYVLSATGRDTNNAQTGRDEWTGQLLNGSQLTDAGSCFIAPGNSEIFAAWSSLPAADSALVSFRGRTLGE